MIETVILVSVGCSIGFLLAIILLSRQRPARQRVWETGPIRVWLPSTSWKESEAQQEQKKSLHHSTSQNLIPSPAQTKTIGKPQRKPVAILSVKGGKYDGDSWLMRDRTAISIGRFNQCNIVLDEHNIAPLHAQITHRDKSSNTHKFAIFDYSANNKTFVNGEPVTAVRLLEDGAQIQIGDTDLIFQRVKQG